MPMTSANQRWSGRQQQSGFSRVAVLFCVLALGCGVPAGDPGDPFAAADGTESGELIGGAVAQPGQFPSSLWLSFCSAAKIGPRHVLTAAHCVWDEQTGTFHSGIHPGASLSVTNEVTLTAASSRYNGTIKKVHVHPRWTAAPDAFSLSPDIAVVEFEQPIGPMRWAQAYFGPATSGTKVSIQGWGCETSVGGASPNTRRLKYQNLSVVPPSFLDASQPFAGQPSNEQTATTYFFTPGKKSNAGAASLCPGDSGGAVYLNDGTNSRIVGVNAYYSFSDPDGVATANWHTRMDPSARYPVKNWLLDTGYYQCPRVRRLSGSSRYGTAAGIALAVYKQGASGAVLVTGANGSPDALAGATLAASRGLPLLLSAPDHLPAETANALTQLGVSSVTIVGGTAAVSENVAQAMRARGWAVQRVSGPDRYSTSASVARMVGGGSGLAFIISGESFVDGIPAAAVAAHLGAPVLLTARNSVPAPVAQALRELGITRTVVLGGTAVISSAVEAQLPSPTRIAGPDRYSTSVRIAEFGRARGMPVGTAWLAQGTNPVDALVAAQARAPLLLVHATGANAEAQAWLRAHSQSVVIAGGASAVPREIEAQACFLTQ